MLCLKKDPENRKTNIFIHFIILFFETDKSKQVQIKQKNLLKVTTMG